MPKTIDFVSYRLKAGDIVGVFETNEWTPESFIGISVVEEVYDAKKNVCWCRSYKEGKMKINYQYFCVPVEKLLQQGYFEKI